jgi:phosphoribosylformimino-5-aminoimidazole carboxamide ribotide isomerase
LELARSLRSALGLGSLYLADLDAIEGGRPQLAIYRRLIDVLSQVWIDAGVRDVSSAGPLFELDRARASIVVGLETIGGPGDLAAILARAGAERVVFSLDLDDGHPRVRNLHAWGTADPLEITLRAIHEGIRRMLILDLARVGTGSGTGTEDLLIRIRAAQPAIDVWVGGGISGINEIRGIREAGSAGVLIGSALHDGRIGARELTMCGIAASTR